MAQRGQYIRIASLRSARQWQDHTNESNSDLHQYMLDLKDDFNRDMGLAIIDAREITRLNKDSYEQFKAYRNRQMLGIDDLGLEPTEVLDYGNILSPVIDLLSYRYNEQLFTVITTNLRPQEIREKYKDRIADRFNEMMTKIIFKNESYRSPRLQK